MSLEILTGSSGAGKSHTVYREIIEASIAHPDKQYLVIVPEQFTMQTQKEIVRMHPRHGLLNVDVLSFHRLSWRVFEEVGGNTLPVLEETGKSLIVQRVIASQQKHLQVLGKTLMRQGAVSRMKSLISELLQYGVTPDDIECWRQEQGTSLLSRKLEDIGRIYRAFREYLEQAYLTTEEIPDVLCRVIGSSRLIRGSVIILDGFTGFTPLQYKVIRELLVLSERVIIPITLDPSEDPLRKSSPHQLFHMSKQTIRKCVQLAEETRTEVLPVRVVDAGRKSRFAENDALRFLEQKLFRYSRQTYAGKPEGIDIYEASDPVQELRHTAAQIIRQVRTKGYRWKDFAVVTGDLETYGEEAADLFKAAGIPCYLDQKHPVLGNLLVEGIRAALQMAAKNYTYESVFRFLRCGLTDFTESEIDELENYVLALGIRGRKRYEETWIRLPKYLEPERIVYLNELRERFAAETQMFHDQMHVRNGTIRTKTEAVYALLMQYHAQEKIAVLQDRLQQAGEPVQAREYAQIYAVVMDLLDKIVEVMGDEKAGMASYAELLDAGFSELRVGTIPPGEDQVLIGDIERTRLKKIRELFFVGVQEGVIPRPAAAGGILSEIDREILKEAQIALAPTAREEICQQRFYLYLTMTKPSEALHLSYARVSKAGQAMMPSYLIGTVRRLFPEITVQIRGEEPDPAEAMETDAGRKQLLLTDLQQLRTRELSAPVRELLLWMVQQPGGEDTLHHLMEAVGIKRPPEGIGRYLAEKLYGRELVNSATRLEQFARCAFAHFCGYGLRLQEREVYAFTPADLGSVMHKALENYSYILRQERQSWAGMTEEQRNNYADQALRAAVSGFENDILHSSGRNEYLADQLRELLHHTVWALQVQVEHGAFRPAGFEFAFSDDLQSARIRLSEGAAMRLTGRIDRLDLCEKDGVHYVKIIDYKTGKTTFDLNKLYHGLQMQLLLYLNAAMESEAKKHPDEKTEPAGVFYYHISDPYLEAESEGTEEETAQKILTMLRPDGRCRSEDTVLGLLDTDLEHGGRKSGVIPVERKKDGGFTVTSKVADGEEFNLMRRYAAVKAAELGERILQGETAASPYQYKDENACTWCTYRHICGFDERLPGYTSRQLYKKDDEDLYPLMKEAYFPVCEAAAAPDREGQE